MKNLIFALQAVPIQPEGGEVSGGDWRFELRIRYLPNDWSEVYEKDNITFMCYYNQVKDSRNRSHNANGAKQYLKEKFCIHTAVFSQDLSFKCMKKFGENTGPWKLEFRIYFTRCSVSDQNFLFFRLEVWN